MDRLAAEAQAQGAALAQQYQEAATAHTARLGQRHAQLAEALAALQRRCVQLERGLAAARHAERAAQGEAAAAAAQAEEQRAACATAQLAGAAAATRVGELEAAMAAAAQAAAEQAAAAKARSRADLEDLQERFMRLLATKDATIGELRRQAAEQAAALGALL